MSFATDIAVQRLDDDRFSAELSLGWSSLVGTHGGYSAAVIANAIEAVIDDPARAIRSFTAQFVRPPAPGEATVTVVAESTGRSTNFLSAQLHQDGRLLLMATAVAGLRRGGMEYDDRRPPRPPHPGDAPRFFGLRPGMHFDQTELMMDPDIATFAGGDVARLAGWMRPLDGEPVTTPWLICAADFFPPTVFARTAGPVQAATIDFSVQLLTADPGAQVPIGAYVFGDMYSSAAAEGFAVETGTIWSPEGKVLATSHQLRLSGE